MINAFITGISGTLGQAVTKVLLARGDVNITGYSRDELKQSQLPDKNKITLYLGCVREKERLIEASRKADIIFHFAALKRVDALEENPEEAYKTNVLGTDNVLHAQRVNGIKRVVLSSTDKAAYPINVYGCTKQISEKLVLRNPGNVVCRYGNVLASRGSVIPNFVDDIRNGRPVKITDTKMTRFFIRIEDAANFVVASALNGINSEMIVPYTGGMKIPSMKSARMVDVAEAIGTILNKEVSIEVIGIRSGEKISECLKMEHESGAVYSDTSEMFSRDDLLSLLGPLVSSL